MNKFLFRLSLLNCILALAFFISVEAFACQDDDPGGCVAVDYTSFSATPATDELPEIVVIGTPTGAPEDVSAIPLPTGSTVTWIMIAPPSGNSAKTIKSLLGDFTTKFVTAGSGQKPSNQTEMVNLFDEYFQSLGIKSIDTTSNTITLTTNPDANGASAVLQILDGLYWSIGYAASGKPPTPVLEGIL